MRTPHVLSAARKDKLLLHGTCQNMPLLSRDGISFKFVDTQHDVFCMGSAVQGCSYQVETPEALLCCRNDLIFSETSQYLM